MQGWSDPKTSAQSLYLEFNTDGSSNIEALTDVGKCTVLLIELVDGDVTGILVGYV